MADAIGIERKIHNRRGKVIEILNYISKFAFESTVVQSLQITTGRKQEFPKDELSSVPFDGKNEARHLNIVTEEIQAKIEKMQEEMNRMREQEHKISTICAEKSEPLKKILDQSLRAKIEKMQEEMNDLMLKCKASVKCTEKSGSPGKKPEENMKGLDLIQKDKKRVFIRSRL